MSRKLFSLIACLVLVLSFGVVPGAAQAEDGGEFVIRPTSIQPPDGSVDIYVPLGDIVIIRSGWGACTRGLAKAWTKQNEISLWVNGESVFSSPKESQLFWGEPESFLLPDESSCVNDVDSGWRVYWEYPLGELAEGTYNIHYEENVDHPFLDGGDYDGDGEPDINEWHISVDFNIIVTEMGSISGTVTNEETGEAIEGIFVFACEVDVYCDSTETDSNGFYKISLPIGTYRVGTYTEADYISEFYDDTFYWEEADDVLVISGEETPNINFTLLPAGTISGRVMSEYGDPLPGLWVDACEYDSESYCASAETDDDGYYSILLPPGEYWVQVFPETGWIGQRYDADQDGEPDRVAVMVGDETAGINFELLEAGMISGWVKDEAGDPVVGIWVDSCEESVPGEEWGSSPLCNGTSTDENGFYTITALQTGNYRVVIWGDEVYLPQFFDHQNNYDEADLVEVEGGQTAEDINFDLTLGGTISGTVYEANSGETIAGVHVDACSTDDTFCNGTETGDSGEYTIMGLLPDKEYRVFVWGQPGWANEVYQETIWWHEATIVSVGATGIDFTLNPGGSISGLVTDADGNPLADIGVDIMDGGFGACSDENGYYSIMGLPFGTYEIVAGRDFCGPHPYAEQVMSGITIDEENPDIGGLDFELVLGGSISGTITAVGGGSVDEEIHLSACFEDDSFCGWASMQDDGTYVITGLLEGEYRVHAYQWPIGNWVGEVFDNTQDWDAFTPVSVTAGQDTPNINFELQLGGSISGTVTAVGGGLIEENIDVSACFEDNSFCGWATVQSDGTYQIIGLLPGEYRVHAYQYPEGGYWIDEVYEETRDWDAYTPVSVVAGGETSGIDFTLELGGGITGVVEDGDGNPIVGVWVVANDYAGDYFVSWGKTDVTGTYRILELPAGSYRVFLDPQNGWTGQEYSPSPVTVVAGLDTPDVDFTLAPDSTISGTVTDVDGNHISERIDVAACWVTAPDVCFWTTVLVDSTYTIIGLPSGEFYVNTYEVPEDGVPWGNWIGYTYDTTITLGVDVDVVDIDFMLSQQE